MWLRRMGKGGFRVYYVYLPFLKETFVAAASVV